MADKPTICKACGAELGQPEEEVNDPEADATPDDPHFELVRRDDGEKRFRCMDTGQMSAPISPDDDGYEEAYQEHHGNGGSPSPTESGQNQTTNEQPSGGASRAGGQIFDFDEEKSQMEILADVVTNPHYELDDAQIREIRSWAQDYEGQMPPNVLEDLLKNMKGVQKQTAQLIRQRYELKLNKWVRKKQQGEQGPPIGVTGGRPMPQSRSSPTPTPSPSSTPTPSPDKSKEKPEGDESPSRTNDGRSGDGLDETSPFNSDLRQERRKRRIERRNEAMDVAVEEMAHEMAPEVARELANNFGTYFGLPAKILEAKAQQDPDWFLEKMDEMEEKLGISLGDIMEESEAKKERQQKGNQKSQSQVDNELDHALQEMNGEEQTQTEPEQQTQNTNTPPDLTKTEHPMKSTPDGGNDMSETDDAHQEMEDMFDETFGGDE